MTPVEVVRRHITIHNYEQDVDQILVDILSDSEQIDDYIFWSDLAMDLEKFGYPFLDFAEVYYRGWEFSTNTKAIHSLFELALVSEELKEVKMEDFL